MTDWAVTATFAGRIDDKLFPDLADRLDAMDGSAANIPHGRFTITLWVDDEDSPLEAEARSLMKAQQVSRDYGLGEEVVAVEAMTEHEFDQRAETPNYPELVSAAEAGEVLGVSRQRVHQLASAHSDFPVPLYELGAGKLWTRAAMEGFARRWTRKPGRPAKEAS